MSGLTPTDTLEDRARAAQLAYGDARVERSHRFARYLSALRQPILAMDELERRWAEYEAARDAVSAADQARAAAIAARESRHDEEEETHATA